jgi:diphthamide synthase (EF-2-diphthine--ammonia ligase)
MIPKISLAPKPAAALYSRRRLDWGSLWSLSGEGETIWGPFFQCNVRTLPRSPKGRKLLRFAACDHESRVTRVILSWSSGKDSAWTLHLLRQQRNIQVAALLTTFNSEANRVAMHAVRRVLVEAQAERTGIPSGLWNCPGHAPTWNTKIECAPRANGQRLRESPRSHLETLFLQDIRDYRVRQLQGTGLQPLFPVWQIPTERLGRDMIAAGLKAKITCVDPSKLAKSFAGQDYDSHLLQALPSGIDPCGENGEFHTFAYDAPVFSRPIGVRTGELVEQDGFVFADLLPQ